MREYELMFIIHPDLDDNAVSEIVNRVSGWISEDGGQITKTDMMGKRELAYAIRKQREGQYVLMQTQMEPTAGAKLERNLRYLEPVMRFLLVAK
jgi:small subunit ribosomal protein S6